MHSPDARNLVLLPLTVFGTTAGRTKKYPLYLIIPQG